MIIETRLCTNRIWKCSYFAIPSQCLNLNNLDGKTAFLKSSYYGSKLVSFQFCTMPNINMPVLLWNFFILSPFSCFLDYFPSFFLFLASFFLSINCSFSWTMFYFPLSLSSSSQAFYFWLLRFFCRRSSKPIFWNHFFNFLEDKKVSMKGRLVFSFQNVGSFALKRWFAFGLKIQRLKLNKKALQCTVV